MDNPNYLLLFGFKYPVFLIDSNKAVAQNKDGSQVEVPVITIPGQKHRIAIDITKPEPMANASENLVFDANVKVVKREKGLPWHDLEMDETKFNDAITAATGMQLSIDYGFVIGTMTPWPTKAGMMSAVPANGFYVWRKEKDGSMTDILLRPQSQRESLEQVIRFLKADAQEIMKMEAGL